jgi:hypothetical protein
MNDLTVGIVFIYKKEPYRIRLFFPPLYSQYRSFLTGKLDVAKIKKFPGIIREGNTKGLQKRKKRCNFLNKYYPDQDFTMRQFLMNVVIK